MAKPTQGENGYPHAKRGHDHPITCDEASYSRATCEKLINAAGDFRCDWHMGAECIVQEAAALEQNKIEAAAWQKEVQQRMDAQAKELAKWEKEEEARLAQEQLEVVAYLQEKEEGERIMRQIEEERRIEEEQEALRLEKEEALRVKMEEERILREELEAMDEWDGPPGECAWDGMDDLEYVTDAAVYDNQCQVLEKSDCEQGGPYGRCQWVTFNHLHYPKLMVQQMEEMQQQTAAVSVDVSSLLNMQVSTLDLILGAAFVLTASFALHQMYRYCREREELKRMSSAEEAAPLLDSVKI